MPSAVSFGDLLEAPALPGTPYPLMGAVLIVTGIDASGLVCLLHTDTDVDVVADEMLKVPYGRVRLLLEDGLWRPLGNRAADLDRALEERTARASLGWPARVG